MDLMTTLPPIDLQRAILNARLPRVKWGKPAVCVAAPTLRNVLAIIAQHEGRWITLRQIAEAAQVSASLAQRAVGTLVKAGLVLKDTGYSGLWLRVDREGISKINNPPK